MSLLFGVGGSGRSPVESADPAGSGVWGGLAGPLGENVLVRVAKDSTIYPGCWVGQRVQGATACGAGCFCGAVGMVLPLQRNPLFRLGGPVGHLGAADGGSDGAPGCSGGISRGTF